MDVSVCVCVFFFSVCVILNQSTRKESDDVSDVSKSHTLLHKTHIKVLLVLRHQGLTCVDPYYQSVK